MTIDIIITIILFFFLISGFTLGFFVEFISIFGLIGVFLGSSYMTPILVESLKSHYPGINQTKGYIIVFVVLYCLLIFIVKYINKILIGQEKNVINRIGGGILALMKGFVISSIIIAILLLVSKFNSLVKKQTDKSKVVEFYNETESYIYQYIPEELKGKMEDIKEKETVDSYIKKIL